MTTDAMRAAIERLAEHAGVDLPAGATVHSFRHGFARAALDSGIDVAHVSQLLGHTSLETTMRYVRERPDDLQRVHQRMRSPDGRRRHA